MKAASDAALDLRSFVRGSFLALLGGATVTIVGCADSSPMGPTAAPQPVIPRDVTGTVMGNHGHSAVISGVQLSSNGGLQLSIKGTASHDHIVELSADEIAQVRGGQRVAKQSNGNSHTHMVVFNDEGAAS